MEENSMLLSYELTTDLEINTLSDLSKLKSLTENTNLKVNDSELSRKLGKDRRTIKKYRNGYVKPATRNKSSIIDEYYEIIKKLLNNPNKYFAYKRVLWQYLKDNYGLNCAASSFRRYITQHPEFDEYFKKNRKSNVGKPSHMRYETEPGIQAQLDWKESVPFTTKDGEVLEVHIFSLFLSYSRYRIYKVSLTKSQDVLFHFLNESFTQLGGVPRELLTDNMKTVMDEARTEYSSGKVNNKFQQFADDYGFKVCPCIAGRPNTKAKVEAPMKILDEIRAYSGDLSYEELTKKVNQINERENTSYHEGYNSIPIFDYEKEKDLLQQLPPSSIRDHYTIDTATVKVNNSSMISYKSNQYSVPPEYISKQLQLQVFNQQLHLYYNKKLVAIHNISEKKLNYLEEHYVNIAKLTFPSMNDDEIRRRAKENMKIVGERFNDNKTRTADKQSGISKHERNDTSS